MSDKIDAWMPLHIGKYIANTRNLSIAEHGMYLMLLMHAWTHGGVIKGDDERIRRICGADPKEWERAREAIMDFLDKQPDGTHRQKRLDAELVKASGIKEVRATAGANGAATTWQKHNKRMAEPVPSDMADEWPIQIQQQETTTTPPSPPSGGLAVDNPKPKRGNGQWWRTPEGIAAEGRRLGVAPKAGESYGAYAQRIREHRERPAA